MIDYSWASIHATLMGFNNQSIGDYMELVFNYATGSSNIDSSNCSWLASCCSHTLHRFTKALRSQKIFKDSKESFELACFCFSLLLNTTDLESSILIFYYICSCFGCQWSTKSQHNAKDFLLDAISELPTEKDEVKTIMRKFFGPLSLALPMPDIDDANEVDEFYFDPTKSIKSQSKFGRKFREVFDNFKMSCENEESSAQNSLYFPDFLIFLLDNYLPYIFIWAGYSLKGLGITSITNGCIEKQWGTRKGGVNKSYPHRYASITTEIMMGQCMDKSKSNEQDDPIDSNDNVIIL